MNAMAVARVIGIVIGMSCMVVDDFKMFLSAALTIAGVIVAGLWLALELGWLFGLIAWAALLFVGMMVIALRMDRERRAFEERMTIRPKQV